MPFAHLVVLALAAAGASAGAQATRPPTLPMPTEASTEVQARQRIDQEIAGIDTELDQAELFRVRVEAIRFGISSDPGGSPDCCDERLQSLRVRNHPA